MFTEYGLYSFSSGKFKKRRVRNLQDSSLFMWATINKRYAGLHS